MPYGAAGHEPKLLEHVLSQPVCAATGRKSIDLQSGGEFSCTMKGHGRDISKTKGVRPKRRAVTPSCHDRWLSTRMGFPAESRLHG